MPRTPHPQSGDRGFTLIELLITIVILSTLSSVVVFAVGGASTQGRDSACLASLRTVLMAVESHQARYGTPPADVPALEVGGWLRPNTTPYFTVNNGVVTGVGRVRWVRRRLTGPSRPRISA
jgi:prepilin-type N-terminal cleavage/methylation domain-containing protein